MNYIEELGKKAKAASRELLKIGTKTKNDVLFAIADELINKKEEIKAANKIDMENGKKNGMAFSLLDRMELTDSRIEGMAQSLREMAMFPDPIGEVITGWNHKNGMNIVKKRVPLGVIGMIYESRPNVTVDAAGLAIKSSNAIILRGSEDALNSNIYLNNLLNRVADAHGLPKNTVQLVEKPERELVMDLIRADKYIDVIIPRGGKGLKRFIIENATIPMIETGAGICHIFVDETADIKQALPIIENAKVQRPSVCNAIETTLATRSYSRLVLRAQAMGYTVHLMFFWLNSVNLAEERVAKRVSRGGHNIAKDVIKRRYHLGLHNLFEVFIPIVDEWIIVDNSITPREILAESAPNKVEIIHNKVKFEKLKDYGKRETI